MRALAREAVRVTGVEWFVPLCHRAPAIKLEVKQFLLLKKHSCKMPYVTLCVHLELTAVQPSCKINTKRRW